jgi:hypothetical protein
MKCCSPIDCTDIDWIAQQALLNDADVLTLSRQPGDWIWCMLLAGGSTKGRAKAVC